jgi:hypothetical protein
MWKKAFILLPAMLLLAGCASTITNLSSLRQLRDPANLYPVEVALDSRQQSLLWDTIQPSVIVGKEAYPMRRTKLMRNRWECVIPVPAGVNSVTYHYKFDYKFNDFGGPRNDSASSHTYKLQILDH